LKTERAGAEQRITRKQGLTRLGTVAALAVAAGLTISLAHAQIGAIPRDAVAMIADAARQANLGTSHYGMAGFDPANVALVEVIDESRRRAAGAVMGLAAVTAIERYPPLLPQIVRATVDTAPGLRDDIARHVVLAFPRQANAVYAAAGSGPLPASAPLYGLAPTTIGGYTEPPWTAIPAHLIEEPRPTIQAATPAQPALVFAEPAPVDIPALPGTVPDAPLAVTPAPQPVTDGGVLGTAPTAETGASPLMVPRETVASMDTGEPELGPHGYPILGTPPGGRSGGGSAESTARLGLGFRVEPAYEGSDEFDVAPLPIIDIKWMETFYLNARDGLGFYLWKLPNLEIGAGFDYRYGREESDADRLAGLGDVDDSFEAAASFRLRFSPEWHASAQFRRDLSSGHEGTTADLGVGYGTEIAPGWRGNLEFVVEWADQDYMTSFFGVDAAQAGRSGLAQFEPDAAFKALAFGGGLNYKIDAHWFAEALIRFSLLTGDAADSPVIESDTQLLSGVGVGYQF
jgi:MipA family protein